MKQWLPKNSSNSKSDAGWSQYLSLASLGIEMGAALAVGMAIGWWLDRIFGTKPWLIVIFTIFGIAAGFLNAFQVVREQAAKDSENEKNDGAAGGR